MRLSESGSVGIETNKSTIDATLTTIDTVPIPLGESILIGVKLKGTKDDASLKAFFEIEAGYTNNSGTVTRQGAVNYQHRTMPDGWDVTLIVSGTNVLIRVVGNALTNIDWECIRITL